MQEQDEELVVVPELEFREPELTHNLVIKIPLSQCINFEKIRMDLWKLVPDRRHPTNSEVVDYLITLYHTRPQDVEKQCERIGKARMDAQRIPSEIQISGVERVVQKEPHSNHSKCTTAP